MAIIALNSADIVVVGFPSRTVATLLEGAPDMPLRLCQTILSGTTTADEMVGFDINGPDSFAFRKHKVHELLHFINCTH